MSLEGLVERAGSFLGNVRGGVKHALVAGALAASLCLPTTLPLAAQAERGQQPRHPAAIEQRVPDYMFHKVSPTLGRYALTPSTLEAVLERLYRAGFVTVPRDAYYAGTLNEYVLPGKRPVLLSNDDGDASVIKWERDAAGRMVRDPDGDPLPSEDSFYGILKRFADEHPGFGSYCTYFLNFKKGATFDDPLGQTEKLLTLIDDPFSDVGYHTVNHTPLGKKDATWMRHDIAAWDAMFTRITGRDAQSVVRYAAYPGGQRPRDPETRKVVEQRFAGASDAWGGAAYRRDSRRFSRYDEPRIEVHNRAEYKQPDTIAWALNLARQEGPWPDVAPAQTHTSGRTRIDLRPLCALTVGSLSTEISPGSFFSRILNFTAQSLDITHSYGPSGGRPVRTPPLLYHAASTKEEAHETIVELLNQGADATLAGSVTRFYRGEEGVKEAVRDHIAAAATTPCLPLTRFSDDDLPVKLKERILNEYLFSPNPLVQIAIRISGESGLRLNVADLSHIATQEMLAYSRDGVACSMARADTSSPASYQTRRRGGGAASSSLSRQ